VGRTSDTRQRTREAAADLVAEGRRPHTITVDLIYAAIGQGSRTTINDELKQWKEEKARADALEADLPPVVADGMRSVWVLAVEHGERVFEARRGELETQLADVREQLTMVESTHEQLRASHELLTRQVATLGEQLAEARQHLGLETAAKNEAVSQAHALQQELTAVRRDTARQLESVRQEQETQTAEFRQAISARDEAFRAELATATERLESAQAHMLQQIDDARQGRRHTEIQAAAVQRQRDQLQGEITELRTQCGVQAHELQQRKAALEKALADLTHWGAERQTLLTDLAKSRGQIEGIEKTVASLEARALAAETRLEEPRTRENTKPAPRSGRRSKGT
jgi:chromosome segregation ATPase